MTLDRRSLFALPALAAAATAAGRAGAEIVPAETPKPAMTAAPQDMSTRIARFIVGTRYADLPQATQVATRRSILDAVGVTLAASGLEPACNPFVDLARAEGGLAQSTILGVGLKVPAASAAMANGAFAHALDYEDVHDPSGMHPNAAVVPAALAVAQAQGGVSGEDFIAAVAVGCDLACRLGLSRIANLNSYGWYFPPIAGAFGATAAAARLMGLDERQTLDALSLTLCQTSCSSELINNGETTIRAIRDAFAAQTGVRSAQLAKAGIRGFDQPFEGAQGFFTMYARGQYKPGAMLDGLGEKFHGEEVSFKAWPACRGAHMYIQAALEMNAASPIDPGSVASIAVTVSTLDKMLCELPSKKAPTTAIDAKFSIPFAVATAIVHKGVNLGSFDEKARANPAVLRVAATVSHRVDNKVARIGSEGGGDVMVLTTRDGAVRAARVKDLYGSPQMPMPDKDFMQKFTDCAGHAQKPMTAAATARLADQILNLDKLTDLRGLGVLKA